MATLFTSPLKEPKLQFILTGIQKMKNVTYKPKPIKTMVEKPDKKISSFARLILIRKEWDSFLMAELQFTEGPTPGCHQPGLGQKSIFRRALLGDFNE